MPYGLKWMEDGNVKECSGRRGGGGGQAWAGRWVLSSSFLSDTHDADVRKAGRWTTKTIDRVLKRRYSRKYR